MGRRQRAAGFDPYVYQIAMADQQGRNQAGALAYRLAAGQPPPVVPGMVGVNGEPGWLNGECDLFSWQAMNVVPNERPVAAFGSPLFVAAAMALGESANRRERRQAEMLSRPQWRRHGRVGVQVTGSGTWVLRGDQWWSYPHATVSRYELDDGGCTMQFHGGFVPVRLVGPAVWPHAVLLAYAQYGPGRQFLRAPYLLPLQHTGGPLPVPVA